MNRCRHETEVKIFAFKIDLRTIDADKKDGDGKRIHRLEVIAGLR